VTDNSVIAPVAGTIVDSTINQILNRFVVNRYKPHSKMITKKKKGPKGEHDSATRIKVQLDHKTMMIVHSMQAFKMWKKRYPLARVIA